MHHDAHRMKNLAPMALAAALGLSVVLVTLIGVTADPGASSGATPSGRDPYVDGLIGQITTQTLMHDLAGLSGRRPVTVAGSPYTISTRNTQRAEAVSMTTRYAYEQLASCGLRTAYHGYTFFGQPRRNVVAEKPGRLAPEEIYLLTAHIDDLPRGPIAPGADDNGSGSVAVMRAGCLLAGEHFAHTIRFVLFTGEEQGLRGSDAYAADCSARGETIAGVINLDMIGYSTGEPVFDVYARSGDDPGASGSRQLAAIFSETVAAYDLNLIPRRLVMSDGIIELSDQWSFLQEGYPAILVIEDVQGDFNPYYHTTSDTVDVVNASYMADLSRAAVAAIVGLGERLPSGVLSGRLRTADSGAPAGVTVTAEEPAYRGLFTATTSAGGTYSATLPVGSYTLTVRSGDPRYTTVVTRAVILTDTVTRLDVRLPEGEPLYLPWIVAPRRSGSLAD